MVKRSPSFTPAPATNGDKDTPSPNKKSKASTLGDKDKAYLMEKAMDLAYKALPFDELSRELGVPESRLKDQFKPKRANLRKMVEQLFDGGK